ncbi:MAG: PaaI family thioesterase [Caulobacter sp.]|nr:PaaI family thioesterase [Caulobacter sp.]
MTWATNRLDALLAGEAAPPPVVETLGLGLLDAWEPGRIRKRWTPDAALANGDGSMFGGYLAALADQALAFAAMTVVPADSGFRTLNLQMNFIRVSRMVPLLIEARVIDQTRQIIAVRADIRREDETLIAEATAQQFLQPFAR